MYVESRNATNFYLGKSRRIFSTSIFMAMLLLWGTPASFAVVTEFTFQDTFLDDTILPDLESFEGLPNSPLAQTQLSTSLSF